MKEREFWLDHIRGVACLLVVLLHTSMSYLYKFNTISMLSWHVGNTVDSFARVSVPLFFMISGYLMMRDRPARLRNILRIVVCIVFYSALCILYVALYRHGDWKTLFVNMYHRPAFYHLWFFYAILGFYLLSTVLTFRKENKNALYQLLVCMILLNPGIKALIDQDIVNLSSRLQYTGSSIFFMLYGIAGAYIGTARAEAQKKYIGLFYFLSSLLIMMNTYTTTRDSGKFVGTYYSYTGPLVVTGALSLFYFISSLKISNTWYKKTLVFISSLSLPIYGVHAIILDYLKRSGHIHYEQPFLDIPLRFLLTLACSIAIAMFVKKFDTYKMVS